MKTKEESSKAVYKHFDNYIPTVASHPKIQLEPDELQRGCRVLILPTTVTEAVHNVAAVVEKVGMWQWLSVGELIAYTEWYEFDDAGRHYTQLLTSTGKVIRLDIELRQLYIDPLNGESEWSRLNVQTLRELWHIRRSIIIDNEPDDLSNSVGGLLTAKQPTLAELCNGVTVDDITELLKHLGVVAGNPASYHLGVLEGKAQYPLSAPIAAYYALLELHLISGTVNDWADAIERKYGMQIGRKARSYSVDKMADASIAFGKYVDRARAWLKGRSATNGA